MEYKLLNTGYSCLRLYNHQQNYSSTYITIQVNINASFADTTSTPYCRMMTTLCTLIDNIEYVGYIFHHREANLIIEMGWFEMYSTLISIDSL